MFKKISETNYDTSAPRISVSTGLGLKQVR